MDETNEQSADELAKFLSIWDQTIGCDRCGKAWWGEDWTPSLADFHAEGCPLKGRQDVLDAFKRRDAADLVD